MGIVFLHVLILYGLYRVARLICIDVLVKSKEKNPVTGSNLKFLMIIPVYKEQKRVQQCIQSMEKLVYDKHSVRIVFCTTNKEPVSESDTERCILDYLKRNQDALQYQYEIARYPGATGSMAEQVNYAYQTCYKNEDIVAVYNADSIPHKDSLMRVAQAFEKKKDVQIIQQRITFFNHLNRNIFSLGYAIHQSLFELNVNIIKDLKNNGFSLCGRGMFVRGKSLDGMVYPTEFFCEDMVLSFLCAGKAQKISTICVFEDNEPPPSLSAIINQHFVWFSTAFEVRKLLKYCQQADITHKKRYFSIVMRRIILNVIWVCGPLLLIYAILRWPWFILMLSIYCLSASLCLFHISKRTVTAKGILLSSFSLLVYLFVYNIGPLKYMLYRLRELLKPGIRFEKYKTPR